MNNKLFAGIALAIVLSTGIIAVSPASALTGDEIQAQIRELLSKVADLQGQLKRLGVPFNDGSKDPASDITVTAIPRVCKVFSDKALALGMRNDDVRGLQEFLQSEGILKADATGYFGTATRDALRSWQLQNGIVAKADVAVGWGIAGPRTREALMKRCGNLGALSVSPQSGAAPLTVVFTSKMGDQSPTRPSFFDGQDVVIDFGDGSERQWVQCETKDATRMGGTCVTPAQYKHTYEKNGVYTAQLLRTGGMCVGTCPTTVLGTATVRVGDQPVACTKEYMPVCGSKQVVCITTPCNPVQQTYGNRCMMNADGATFVHEGQCRSDIEPQNDRRCKAWFDGCNSCARSGPDAPAACTLKACSPESMQKPYCKEYFDRGKTPVVSEFSGPTSLTLNETGTWKISASDPENGSLKYSITWGDEWQNTGAGRATDAQSSIVQSTMFTHSYARAGSYTVIVVVSDMEGNQAKTSATVQVTNANVACTLEYAPVCGRPQGCSNSCPTGMYCTAVCRLHDPVTYGNKCALGAANATFLHSGECTAASASQY